MTSQNSKFDSITVVISSNNKNKNKNNTNNNSTTNKCIKRPKTMIIIMIINDTAKAKCNKMITKFDNKMM